MTVDLTGGLADEREYVFGEQPANPDMRESVNAWIWDDGVEFGLPRVAIEAVADQWETHDLQVNFAFGSGRVLQIFRPGEVHDPLGADGKPRVLGAGALSFELVEPFRKWRMHLHGEAIDTTAVAQIAALRTMERSPERVQVDVELEFEHVVPPWENGTVKVGDTERTLQGGALRIRRQGIRRLATFWGHAWQSTVFPSGRAFGYIVYPDRADGKPTYNEGYLFEGDGELLPARVLQAPWLRSCEGRGEDVSVVLETDDGRIHEIAGELQLPTYHGMVPEDGVGLVLQQSIVRYTYDGESANGMMERSMPSDQVDVWSID